MAPLEEILTPFKGILSDGTEILVPLRVSYRCKRIILRSTERGFELVLPPGISPETARDFCSQHLDWIEKIKQKQNLFSRRQAEQEKSLPDEIFLPFTGELFQVIYQPGDVSWSGARREANQIIVSGKTDLFEPAAAALRNWLIRYAGEILLPYAAEIAGNHGFSGVTKYRTGIQKNSWGTCTCKGVITLNAALLCFTKLLAEYVILHELCHLKELNHSPEFWRYLDSVCPGAKEYRESLKNARKDLPCWVLPD